MSQPSRPEFDTPDGGFRTSEPAQGNLPKPKRTRNRRVVSCLPCRRYKLRCDRTIPCHTCRQYNRQDQCRMQSAAETDSSLPRNAQRRETSTELTSTAAPDPVADAVPSNTQFTSPSTAVGTTPDLGLYQSSFKTQEQAGHSQGTPFGLDPSLRAIAESRLKPIQLVTTIPPIQPRPYQGNTSTPPEGKTKLSVASLALQNPFSSKNPTLFDETQLFWKRYLLSLLPTQTQADLLVTYFFENINWIYHAVHAPVTGCA